MFIGSSYRVAPERRSAGDRAFDRLMDIAFSGRLAESAA
jgi:hypothetical protein